MRYSRPGKWSFVLDVQAPTLTLGWLWPCLRTQEELVSTKWLLVFTGQTQLKGVLGTNFVGKAGEPPRFEVTPAGSPGRRGGEN